MIINTKQSSGNPIKIQITFNIKYKVQINKQIVCQKLSYNTLMSLQRTKVESARYGCFYFEFITKLSSCHYCSITFIQIIMQIISFLVLIIPIISIEFNCANRLIGISKFRNLNPDELTAIRFEGCSLDNKMLMEMFSEITSMKLLHTLILKKIDTGSGFFTKFVRISMPSLKIISLEESNFGDDEFNKLLQFNMENITQLNFIETHFTMNSFKAIRNANLTNLQSIQLSRNKGIGKAALDLLADLYLPKLTKIYTGGVLMEHTVVDTIAKFDLEKLEQFSTGNPMLGDRFISKFAELKMPKLKILGLPYMYPVTLAGWKQFFNMQLLALQQLRIMLGGLDMQKLSLINANKLPRLKLIALGQNSLNERSFELFAGFEHLEKIHLQYNNISSLSGLEKVNPNLKSLYLLNNDISDQDLHILCRFKSLEELILNNNAISDDGLEKIRGCIFQNLTALSLQHNYLTNRTLEILSTMGLKNLKALVLRSNKLGQPLNKNFTLYFPKLETLDLKSTQAGDYVAELFSKASLQNLVGLDMSHNNIGDMGLAYICGINYTNISKIILQYNRFQGFGLLNLKEDSFKTLEILVLKNNKLGEVAGYCLSRLNLSSLTGLDLSDNELNDAALIELSKINMPDIISLVLSGNRFHDEGLLALTKMNLSQLRALDVGFNEITGRSVGAIYNCTPNIEMLMARNCRIADNLFEYIDQANIKMLYMMNNFLNDQFIMQLSKRPDIYQKLQIMILNNNDLTDLSLKILSKMNMPQLILMVLNMNEFTDAGRVEFLNKIQYPKLQGLSIDAKSIDPSQFAAWSKGFMIG